MKTIEKTQQVLEYLNHGYDWIIDIKIGNVDKERTIKIVGLESYLDRFDRELKQRELKFVRHGNDCKIFVRSELVALIIIKSVTSLLENKLFIKDSIIKLQRPYHITFLGYRYHRDLFQWQCKRID